ATAPAVSTMHTAWSALAQSIPADSPPGGVPGRETGAYFITASSLLAQWGGTLVHGSGTRLPVVSLIGAHPRRQPCRRSARPGTPPGPAGLIQDVKRRRLKRR